MKDHIIKMHSFNCSQCQFKSGYLDELKLHIIEDHDGNYCEPCNFQANTEIDLHRHNNSTHYGLSYPCEKCGYFAPSRINLLAHIESTHEMSLHCM